MAGGKQRKVRGPVIENHGKIAANGSALIGMLMFHDGDYFSKYSTHGGTTSGLAGARAGVLVAGSQDGHQTDDRKCMCDLGGAWRFPLDVVATVFKPAGTLVAAAGNEVVALLTAGNEIEAIGELDEPVEIGDDHATFRFFQKAKTT